MALRFSFLSYGQKDSAYQDLLKRGEGILSHQFKRDGFNKYNVELLCFVDAIRRLGFVSQAEDGTCYINDKSLSLLYYRMLKKLSNFQDFKEPGTTRDAVSQLSPDIRSLHTFDFSATAATVIMAARQTLGAVDVYDPPCAK